MIRRYSNGTKTFLNFYKKCCNRLCSIHCRLLLEADCFKILFAFFFFKVVERSFLVPMRYSRYNQTTANWAAKIGKMQFQLKKLYFDMFCWTKYRWHGNTAGNRPALKNGFDLFSENSVVRFFPSLVSKSLGKILAY